MTITAGDILVSASFVFMGVMWLLYLKYLIWGDKKKKEIKRPFDLKNYNVAKIKDAKLRELILSIKEQVNVTENTMKLVNHTTGIDLHTSYGFIKFDTTDVYEIKEIHFGEKQEDGDLNVVYVISRSSDGLTLTFDSGTVKEIMVGCVVPKTTIRVNYD